MGVLSFEEGKYDRALEEFNTAIRAFPVNHAPLFPFALTLLKTGHRTEAIHELQRLTVWTPILNGAFDLDGLAMSESRMVNPVLARYWLGVAHDESGDKVQAVKELETFLGIWKGADFKSAEILDAQARLRKLKGTPAG
jgi:predicted Zn-dependent protease